MFSNIDGDDDEELARDHSQPDIADLPVEAEPAIALESDDDVTGIDLAWDSPLNATPENTAEASSQNVFSHSKPYDLDFSVQDSGDLDPFDMDLVMLSDLESTQNNSVTLYDFMEDEELFIHTSPPTVKVYPFGCERPIPPMNDERRDDFDDVLDMCSDGDDCTAADIDMILCVDAPSGEEELDWDEDDGCFLK